jgi:hypothetical protein
VKVAGAEERLWCRRVVFFCHGRLLRNLVLTHV